MRCDLRSMVVLSLVVLAACGGPDGAQDEAEPGAQSGSDGVTSSNRPSSEATDGQSPATGLQPASGDEATAAGEVQPAGDEEIGKSQSALTGWKLVFQDDFNGTAVNQNQWGMYYSAGHAGNGLRRPEAFTVKDGLLVVTAKMVDGTLVSGGMAHKTNFTYGRVEFRVRTEADPSSATSGLVLTWPQGRWPAGGENDIYETTTDPDRSPFHTFIHFSTTGTDNQQKHHAHPANATQWHTMAMEWEPAVMRIFRDGAEVFTITDKAVIPDVPHHVCIQLDAFKKTMGAPVRMFVDWVRIYQRLARKHPRTTTMRPALLVLSLSTLSAALSLACGDDSTDDSPAGAAGSGAASAAAGSGGKASSGGKAGASAGQGGATAGSGQGGSAGHGGAGASAAGASGQPQAGQGGAAGAQQAGGASGEGQSGSAQAGSGGSAQAGGGGSEASGSGGSSQAGQGGSSQAGQGGSSQAGSAGSGGEAQAGQGGASQAGAAGASGSSAGGQAGSASSEWKLVFEDNFDGDAVNEDSWGMYYSPGHDGNGLRRPEAFTVKDGLLVVTAKMVDGTLVSGGMAHKTNFTYGRVEFRVRTEADPSSATSGLVLTWPQSEKWPADGENDIYETTTDPDRSPFHTFIHYSTSGKDNQQKHFAHDADGKEWHTVAMEWEPDVMRIFRDGAEVFTITDKAVIPDVPHHVCIQLDALKKTMGDPVHMFVDWVRVYQH